MEARSLGWLALAQAAAPRTPIENFIESHTPTKAKVYRQTPHAARRQATPAAGAPPSTPGLDDTMGEISRGRVCHSVQTSTERAQRHIQS